MMLAGKLKNFAKDSVFYGVGDVLGRLISLVMLPILSRAFTPGDYGAIDLLNVGYVFLMICASLDVLSGVIRFYYKLNEKEQKTLVTSTAFFITLLSTAVAILLILFSTSISEIIIQSDKLVLPIKILAVCLPIENLYSLLILLLRVRKKPISFAMANISRVITVPLLTYYTVIILHTGINGVFYSKFIWLFMVTATLMVIERKQFCHTVNIDLFHKVVAFALPGHPGMIIKQAMDIIPRIILAAFAPLSAVGLFGIASRISQVMSLFVMAFNRSWGPFAYEHADKPEERDLYEIIFKSYAFCLIFLGLGLSLFAKEVIMILTPPQYHSASLMAGGIVFFLGVEGLTMIFSTALYVIGQVKWKTYLNAVRLTTFLLFAFILVPRYQTWGLIASLDLAVIIYFLGYHHVAMKYFEFPIPRKQLFILLICASILVVLFNMASYGFVVMVLFKLIIVSIYFVLGILFIFTTHERKRIFQMIHTAPFITKFIS